MMELIRNWTLTMCVTAVAGAIAGMIAPKVGAGKIFKITLSTFFLCCMIVPFFDIPKTESPSFSQSFDNVGDNSHINEMIKEQTVLGTQNILENKLESYIQDETGISPVKIELIMNTEDEEQIYISEALVTVTEQSYQTVKSIEGEIKKTFGISKLEIKSA